MDLLELIPAILLVFYLAALTRFAKMVKRSTPFFIGCLAMLLMILGEAFRIYGNEDVTALVILERAFLFVGIVVGFWAAVIACYAAKLPLEKAFNFDLRDDAEGDKE